MVIRGRIRGNGRQLAQYLLTKGENERIDILEVNGNTKAKDRHVHDALFAMNITAELTKTGKGLYHAQINPAYTEDKKMTAVQWQQAADVLAAELKLSEQNRVIVLHTKKGRTHAHVVWERYDHERGKIIDNKFSRLAQDRARKEMEKIFEHKKTPERNEKRPEMKKTLSEIWRFSADGKTFMLAASAAGYRLAAGEKRRPFMVVDGTGRSFDLVRQLDKVNTKAVREKLQGLKLPTEKKAIADVRATQQEKNISKASLFADNREGILETESKRDRTRRQFAEQMKAATQKNKTQEKERD